MNLLSALYAEKLDNIFFNAEESANTIACYIVEEINVITGNAEREDLIDKIEKMF